MPFLHLANVYFEEELERGSAPTPEKAIAANPLYNKLQWLPFLYAAPDDGVIVTAPPPKELFDNLPAFPLARCHLFSKRERLSYQELSAWGATSSIASWAKKSGVAFTAPSFDVVQEVNSKIFSFQNSPALPGAALIYEEKQLANWLMKGQRRSVLKNSFGLSGRGHLFLPDEEKRALAFAQKEWAAKRPVIAEPWVKRLDDFSTQWKISPEGEVNLLGLTRCLNDPYGRYQATLVGILEPPYRFDEHLETAMALLHKIAAMGYFGHVGIDAMVYEDEEGDTRLHPIVEINARKTMGWVALQMQERFFPDQRVKLRFCLTRKEFAIILERNGGGNIDGLSQS